MLPKGIKLAYIFAVSNAVIIGFSFLFTKIALGYAEPLDTLTYRFAASFIMISVPVAFGWVKLSYRGKPLYKLLLLATMYPLGFFTLQAFGLQRSTSAEGGILYAFTPVVTLLLASLFLKERTTLPQKLSIFLSVFGVVFIFIMKKSSFDLSNIMGILLLFLTCVAFAGYSVLARSLVQQFSPAEISYFMMTVGFATFLVVSMISHATRGTLGDLLHPLSSGTFITAILYLGVVASLVTTLMTNYILTQIEASVMSVFTNLAVIVSIAAGAIFLGEGVTLYHWIGSLLIIAGVIGTNRLGQKRNRTCNKL
ncbi:DMT family transporter [Paenibacillus monticola]|uniref:EamA family transporter n=1 Tax=Paenibacillus monticola TaxID=2666075 RepID=A0A7X2L3S0_9BACL|nr:DMT family transporter [Paenibacillus monticola]MRN56272.1 EamA family transporter [Paenibacillus monticola]